MDLFRQFVSTEYGFFPITRGLEGSIRGETTYSTGIFKYRDGVEEEDNIESYGKINATLHVRPSEPYLVEVDSLVNHGIEYRDKTYRIIAVKEGMDFSSGRLHFYKLELTREDIAEWQQTPLE